MYCALWLIHSCRSYSDAHLAAPHLLLNRVVLVRHVLQLVARVHHRPALVLRTHAAQAPVTASTGSSVFHPAHETGQGSSSVGATDKKGSCGRRRGCQG